MKLDFLSLGGGGAPDASAPRRTIDRRMRLLDMQPLDKAGRTVRVGLIVGFGFIALILLFALVAPISSAAIASGEVTVSGDKYQIQPVTGGIVTQVLVKEGQLVRAGQPLVRLNGVKSGASLAQAQAERDTLQALEARLVAERDGAERLVFPADLTSRASDPVVARAMAGQQALFARHMAVLAADRANSDQSLAAATAQQAAARKQLALIEDELRDYRMLYERGFARKTTIRSLERTQAQLQADTAAGLATTNQARIAAQKVRDSQMVDLSTELAETQAKLAQITPQLEVSRYAADQDVLRAPTTGRVSGIQSMGPGMVLSGGTTIMELVPTGRPLIVEVRVKPADIDDVRVGQKATVRFSTANPHGQNAFDGTLVTLSPASMTVGEQTFYKAQVTIDDPAAVRREGLGLQPGVPASVNITTADRTLFEYIFGPLTAAFSRSFREE